MNVDGYRRLTDRQKVVLEERCRGTTIEVLATRLEVHETTINNEIRRIKDALEIEEITRETCLELELEQTDRRFSPLVIILGGIALIAVIVAITVVVVWQIQTRVVEPVLGVETDTPEPTMEPTIEAAEEPAEPIEEPSAEESVVEIEPSPTPDLNATGTIIAATIIAGQPTPDHRATETAIAASILTEIAETVPTDTPLPTETPTPSRTPTQEPPTLIVGDTWSDGRVALILEEITFNEVLSVDFAPFSHGIVGYFRFDNLSEDFIQLILDIESFEVIDNIGREYGCRLFMDDVWRITINTQVNAGTSFQFKVGCLEREKLDTQARHVTFYTSNVSSLGDAIWEYDIPR